VEKFKKNATLKRYPRRNASTQKDSTRKSLKNGATAYHIICFVEGIMDVLDRHSKKGLFIVMDNYRIHHSHFVVDTINKGEYKTSFMPSYSPFLNFIKESGQRYKKKQHPKKPTG
jgi:hypothetical protein